MLRWGTGWIEVMLIGGVKGLAARLNNNVARFRPFFSPFPSVPLLIDRESFAVGVLAREAGLPGPFVPNLCTVPDGEEVTGVDAPDRLTVTALAIASMVRDTVPGVGAALASTFGRGFPTCGGLTFSETILGVRVFLNTLSRWVLSALSGLKKFGET